MNDTQKKNAANSNICEAETRQKKMNQSSIAYADICAYKASVQNMQGGTGGTFGCLRGCDWQAASKSQWGKIVCLAG